MLCVVIRSYIIITYKTYDHDKYKPFLSLIYGK